MGPGRNRHTRPHLRFLAMFTPEQRQEAASAAGLPFTKDIDSWFN